MTSALAKSWSSMNCQGPTATPSVMLPAVTVEILAMFCTSPSLHSGGAAPRKCVFQLWHWRRRIPAGETAPRSGDTERHHHPRTTSPARPRFFCNACRRSSAPVNFSGPPNWKLAVSCNLTAWSACRRCDSEGSQPRVLVFQLPPFPEPGCAPRSRRRLVVLHRDFGALAPAHLAQRETGFDVSTPPPQRAWDHFEAILFVDFDSCKRFGQ